MACLAKSSMPPGMIPRNSTAAAAIVSAARVPKSTRARVDVRGLCLVVGRGVHREHDAQVDERGDRRREHADQREHVLALVHRRAEHRELRDEPTGERHAGLREQEQREHAGEQRLAAREPAVVGERVLVVALRRDHRHHRERADRHHRVREHVEQRRARALRGRGLHRDQDVAGVTDRRVGEHALHVGLHDRGDAPDEQRDDGERRTRSAASRRCRARTHPRTRAGSPRTPRPWWPTP